MGGDLGFRDSGLGRSREFCFFLLTKLQLRESCDHLFSPKEVRLSLSLEVESSSLDLFNSRPREFWSLQALKGTSGQSHVCGVGRCG